MNRLRARRREHARRWLALACAGTSLCCGSEDAPSSAEWGRPGEIVAMGGIRAPRRAEDDGTPDSCELLGRADPSGLLGERLAVARRVYGLCLVDAEGPQDPERSIGLEIRRDAAAVARNLDEFWVREGAGVAMLGSSRERIQLLPEPGDFSLWFPIEGGLQLFSYWEDQYVLVLTIRGVPTVRALPWARDLARASVAAS